jgi:MFS superfamily sulfate permease-like transporter
MRKPDSLLRRYLPVLDWGRGYDGETLTGDLVAAVIVTIMLIPQSLAYALLAGLPPEAGLYASIVPIILYALFGTSRALAVGPVAVVSLMTAAAIGKIAEPGSSDYMHRRFDACLHVGRASGRDGASAPRFRRQFPERTRLLPVSSPRRAF